MYSFRVMIRPKGLSLLRVYGSKVYRDQGGLGGLGFLKLLPSMAAVNAALMVGILSMLRDSHDGPPHIRPIVPFLE